MTDFFVSVIALIVTLGVLITFHEFGHFWVARRLGVKVLRFSVGFGKPIWLRRGKVDDTEFVVTAIPLGGYVKMLDEREGDVPADELERAFNRKSVWARIAIVAAGPLFNFIFAILAYSLMFMVGVNSTRPLLDAPTPESIAAAGGFQQGDLIVAIDGKTTPTLDTVLLTLIEKSMEGAQVQFRIEDADGRVVQRTLDLAETTELSEKGRLLTYLGLSLWQPKLPPVIDKLKSGGAGELAGLQGGDRIVAIDGNSIESWQQWAAYIRARPEQHLAVVVERAGERLHIDVVPAAVETEQGMIGLIGAYGQVPEDFQDRLRIVVRYGFFESIVSAAGKTWDMSLFTLRILGRMLIGQASLENISGPITIAQFAGQSASIGWVPFLSFLALVSISLGVLNLLPVPILDGGHLLYYFIEIIKGSPLPEAAQYFGQRIGIALLLMLMSLAIFNDLVRLFG